MCHAKNLGRVINAWSEEVMSEIDDYSILNI